MKLKFKHIAIDFDGTIAYDAYPNVGELIPGAKETMNKIIDLGGEIAIWTCRTGEAKDAAIRFLLENNIPFTKFNKPFDENVNIYGGDNARKIYADIYIDDRSLHFQQQPVDWDFVQNIIFTYEEWMDGDRIECIKEIPGNFKVGDRHTLNIRRGINMEDRYIIGAMGTDKESAQEYFKKVN